MFLDKFSEAILDSFEVTIDGDNLLTDILARLIKFLERFWLLQ